MSLRLSRIGLTLEASISAFNQNPVGRGGVKEGVGGLYPPSWGLTCGDYALNIDDTSKT